MGRVVPWWATGDRVVDGHRVRVMVDMGHCLGDYRGWRDWFYARRAVHSFGEFGDCTDGFGFAYAVFELGEG